MKNKVLSVIAAGLALGFVSCNNSGESTGSVDSSGAAVPVSTSSNGNYAARADTVKTNVAGHYYLNPRTGKAYTSLTVDPNTGKITDESGMPVRRYVDNRTWWVYDVDTWDTVGSARMNGDVLKYRGEKGDWMDYDKRWTDDGMNMTNDSTNMNSMDSGMNNSNKASIEDNGEKTKDANSKIKVTDNGNKMKIKKVN